MSYEDERAAVEQLRAARTRIGAELGKVIVGQAEAVDQLLTAVLAGGHCLLTGAPGLAKTLLVRSLAQLFDLRFQRIQFTPDLMPADITGTEILQQAAGERRLVFVRGPVFANVVLADEINRTPPKTQAALLEAMQEQQVTAAGVSHALERPFFVLATQNPIEMEGTYPLPEAQLDRFMLNVFIDYLPEDDELAVVLRTTAGDMPVLAPLYTGADLLRFQRVVRGVPIAEEVARYAVRLAGATRPRRAGAIDSGTLKGSQAPRDGAPAAKLPAPHALDFVNEWVRWGAGLRAAQYLVLGAKARALLAGRFHVAPEDIQALALPVLRHRVLLGYRAEAEGITVDAVVRRLLEAVPAL
jgi:MoxR-like ATPase